MAANSIATPAHEFSKTDVEIILVFNDGELPLANRWEEMTFTPGGQNGTMKGSGKKPRSHVTTRYEPELSITTDKDLSDYIVQRAELPANRGVVSLVKVVRQRPADAPITDVYKKWKPMYGETAYNDDATAVEVTGMLLDWTADQTKAIRIA